MKKLNITLFALISAICMLFGVFSMSNVNLASADSVSGATPTLSETKVKISNDNTKMLLVTAIKDKADVYEVGYTFTGEVTTTSAVKNKYYTSIANDTDSITAGDLFGSDWSGEDVGMIIWEINFALGTSYEYKAYAKVGNRNGSGQLVLPETEVVVTPVDATSKTFYTVAFDTDGGNAIATELVQADAIKNELNGIIPVKEGYDFVKWQINGEDIPETLQQNITVKAVWSAKTYTATFMADGDTVATKIYNHGATELDQEPEVPFKAGFVGAWESYELAVGGVTINAVYTAVDYNNYPTYSVSVDFDMRDTTPFDVDLPSEIAEYTVVSSRLTSYGDGTLNAAVTNNNDGTVNVPKSVPNRGENTISVRMVEESTRSYATVEITLTKADMILTTKQDLTDFATAMNNKTTGNKYYVLGANIDYENGQYFGGWPSDAYAGTFAGTFDGRGYKISNLNTREGLFDTVSGVVKNLILDSPIVGSSQGAAVCKTNAGTIENCMVITRITAGEKAVEFAGFAHTNTASGVIKNCVVVIEDYKAYDSHKEINAISLYNNGTVSNCYAIVNSDYINVMYGTNTDGLYKSADTFFKEVKTLSSADGWNSYWKIENGGLYFDDSKVL